MNFAPLTVSRLAVVQGGYLFVGCRTLCHTMMSSMPQAESHGAVMTSSAACKKIPGGGSAASPRLVDAQVGDDVRRLEATIRQICEISGVAPRAYSATVGGGLLPGAGAHRTTRFRRNRAGEATTELCRIGPHPPATVTGVGSGQIAAAILHRRHAYRSRRTRPRLSEELSPRPSKRSLIWYACFRCRVGKHPARRA